MCGQCGFTSLIDNETPPPDACENCELPRTDFPGNEPRFRCIPAAIPAGFRTMLYRADDAGEETERAPGYAITLALTASAQNSAVTNPTGLNTTLRLVHAGRVYRVNDNAGKLFEGSSRTFPCGFYRGTRWNEFGLDRQWIAGEFQDGGIRGQPERIALVAAKSTDVLQIRPRANPNELALDPLSPGSAVRAAYYSAGFLLAHAVAAELDVDPAELEVSSLFRDRILGQGTDDRYFGVLFINDRLPNGAGFTRWLNDHYRTLLCSVLNGSNPFAARILDDRHRGRCDSRCPVCLQHFSEYELPRAARLATRNVSLLRVLADEACLCGLDGSFTGADLEAWPSPHGGSVDWVGWAAAIVSAYCHDFGCEPQMFGRLPGFIDTDGRAVVVVHPLWPEQSNVDGNILASALSAASGGNRLRTIDSFNLAARPAWVRRKLSEGN